MSTGHAEHTFIVHTSATIIVASACCIISDCTTVHVECTCIFIIYSSAVFSSILTDCSPIHFKGSLICDTTIVTGNFTIIHVKISSIINTFTAYSCLMSNSSNRFLTVRKGKTNVFGYFYNSIPPIIIYVLFIITFTSNAVSIQA